MGFAPTHAARELAAKRARCEAAEIEDELFWKRGYPEELKLRLTPELQKRYHKLSQGQMFEIE